MTNALGPRVRAPELRGRAWLNTGGRTLTLADLRGRITLLDFWTFCCINCLHVLDELRPLEEKYADVLVTVGVHSPKFEHEKDADALAAAVERYGVDHPVLDDPELRTWKQYAAKAWPTLTVIDPEGYVVWSMAGEGHAEALDRIIGELVAQHEAKGTLHRGASLTHRVDQDPTSLRFPSKAVIGPNGTLFVADAAHHSIVELDGEWEMRRFGTGQRGHQDGAKTATFNEPNGLCLLPPDTAEAVGYDIVIADTVNHLLRGLNLTTGEVSTVAGTGKPWRSTVDHNHQEARSADLSSPWDVEWYDGKVIVAMAGIHQLWWFDPVERTTGVYAGTTVEALKDGPLAEVWMAQPSGLSASPDGRTLWIADSESSALRSITNGVMSTAVGQGLFDFGHVDGPAKDALLQHPLGVLALTNGTVLIADTYNGSVRRYDPSTAEVSTVATDLAEPSGLIERESGEVLVVESGAHRLVPLRETATVVKEQRHRTERPRTVVAPGELSLDVIFSPAPGQKLDHSFGSPIRLEVTASPPTLLLAGAGVTDELHRKLIVSSDVDGGVLQVTAQVATCDADSEYAACHLTRQDWGVPIEVDPGGVARLPLVLRGLDS